MIKQDISGNRANIIYLGIGSNLGNRKLNIEKTKFFLNQNRINCIKISEYYETPSWPDTSNPKFLNIVLKVKCLYNPFDLLEVCKLIEFKLGRRKSLKNSPRVCDIDIIDYNKKIILKNTKQNLVIPHPKMHKRNFVLLPMFEICKKWTHPVHKVSIKVLINSLKKDELRGIKIV